MARALHVISGITVIFLIVVGVLFVFGDEVLRAVNSKKLLGSSSSPEIIDEAGEIEEISGTGGIEDSNVGEKNFEEVVGTSNCKMQQIQYSLRNFKNSVKCTDTGESGCTRLVVSCSMEVYSFDKDISGIFGIRYSLVDLDNEELDFRLIENEVGFGKFVIFSTEFVRSNMLGVDENLTCPFTVETVPLKEVCN